MIAPGARSFLLSGNDVGLVIIHGYGGSIGDYRQFAELLHGRGYTVVGLRLPGHGQGLTELAAASIDECRSAVADAIHEMRPRCTKVIIVGASFGGILALDAAAGQSVDGIVTVNAPVVYRGGGVLQGLALRLLRLITPYYPKLGLTIADKERYAQLGSSTAWPINGILSTYAFIRRRVLPALPRLTAPVLLMSSAHDPVVSASSAKRLYEAIGSIDKSLVTIPGRTHRPFRDSELTKFMADTVADFIRVW